MATADPARDVLDLTRQLVAIDSVNPTLVATARGEAAIAAFVADRLENAGFTVRTLAAASDDRRVSVIAVREGSRPGRTIVLNGHLDTVGVEGMDDPFTARIDGDRLLGRGTSDMKGGVAGLIVAAETLAAADAPGRIIVTLVADEEDGSVGAMQVIDELTGSATAMDLCLIAEPTWLDLPVAHRGYSVVKVSFRGVGAHSSQPELGVDALLPVGSLLQAVTGRYAELVASAQHPLLSCGSMMTTVVRGGSAPFTVAAESEVWIERRTLPGEADSVALDEVRALVAALPLDPRLDSSVELIIRRDAWEADATGPAAEFSTLLTSALPAAGGATPQRTGAPYWMESALWQAAGVPTVVCGPAGGGLHAIDEWVDIPQLQRFPIAVADAAGRFLSS